MAVVREHRVVAVRQRADKVVYTDSFTRFNDLFVIHILLAVNDILFDGPLEYPGILMDHTELFVYVFAPEPVGRNAVDTNLTAVPARKSA